MPSTGELAAGYMGLWAEKCGRGRIQTDRTGAMLVPFSDLVMGVLGPRLREALLPQPYDESMHRDVAEAVNAAIYQNPRFAKQIAAMLNRLERAGATPIFFGPEQRSAAFGHRSSRVSERGPAGSVRGGVIVCLFVALVAAVAVGMYVFNWF